MADVIFSHPLDLMSRTENRFIVETIKTLIHRVGVLSQVPHIIKLKLNSLIFRKGKRATEVFVQMATKIALARVQRSVADDHRDAFKVLIDAKDSETGQNLDMRELLAETGVLIVAGKP
jgi:cytochrome P450